MKRNELIDFCETVLNENNQRNNVTCYDGEQFDKFQNVRIVLNRKHEELYNQLLVFCSEHNGIVISTNPGTYATIIRVETI